MGTYEKGFKSRPNIDHQKTPNCEQRHGLVQDPVNVIFTPAPCFCGGTTGGRVRRVSQAAVGDGPQSPTSDGWNAQGQRCFRHTKPADFTKKWEVPSHDGSMYVCMVTLTINIHQYTPVMLAYLPYMDPMGMGFTGNT